MRLINDLYVIVSKLNWVHFQFCRLIIILDGGLRLGKHKSMLLEIADRAKLKVACLTFRCLNGSAPSYLSDLISRYAPGRELRSGDKNLLICKPFHLILFGKRAFSCAAPLLWNSLPDSIRQAPNLNTFRSLLIRHLLSKNSD